MRGTMDTNGKEQITIPAEVCERLGLRPHTEVRFEAEGNVLRILREERLFGGRGRQLLERMRGRAASGMSTQEIMELTRGES
jgi:bifunctional DNA-binding transcriptional regulator/antitoxin component of YhaV-PrlF toxin-antitoxin module